jgi:kynurenine formamidase
MRRVLVWISAAGLAAACGGFAFADQTQQGQPLRDFYNATLSHAKYIDLTHALAPGGPLGEGFVAFTVGPAHENEHGATISDIPATVALRPLVVVNVAPKVAKDPGYQATVAEIKSWERRHGPVPAGSVVMIRSDWSKKWTDPKRFTAAPFPGVSLEALEYLHLKRHILMHGHEPLDTDNTAPELVAEKWRLRHNFAQAEGVANLDQVPEAGALITIGFAKFEGGTGGLARYIAIAPASWPYGATLQSQSGAPLPTHARPLRRGADGVLRENP